MRVERIPRGTWPEGISDGLASNCVWCGEGSPFDYRVSDELWLAVVPEWARRGVVCFSCLDGLARASGLNVADGLEEIQVFGIKKTILLVPAIVYLYE